MSQIAKYGDTFGAAFLSFFLYVREGCRAEGLGFLIEVLIFADLKDQVDSEFL